MSSYRNIKDLATRDKLVLCFSNKFVKESEELTQLVTEEEVCRVVFSMKAYKSPGLDGFPSAFFQHFLDVTKVDFIRFSCDFFKTRKLLK